MQKIIRVISLDSLMSWEKAEKISLKFPFSIKEASEVNLLEDKIKPLKIKRKEVEIQIDRFGIHTLKIRKE